MKMRHRGTNLKNCLSRTHRSGCVGVMIGKCCWMGTASGVTSFPCPHTKNKFTCALHGSEIPVDVLCLVNDTTQVNLVIL